MIRIAVMGAAGRMGREIIRVAIKNEKCQLAAAICKKDSPFLGMDAGVLVSENKTGIQLTDCIEGQMDNVDIVIDFSSPDTTMELLSLCRKHKKGLVTGTTGFSESDKQIMQEASEEIPIVFSPNMSPGVNLMFVLMASAARALGAQCDVEIIEKHHRDKLDSPSGTALKMGEVIAEALDRSLAECAVYGRHGIEKSPRSRESIGFSSIRAGDIVGEHTALFAGEGEQLEITHKSTSRTHYATGAIQAAIWLYQKPAGMYSMMNVLEQTIHS